MQYTQFNIFVLALKFGMFEFNLKISFIVFFSIVFHCCSNRCLLSYNMIRQTAIGSIWSPSDGTGSGATDPIVLIQYVNGWEPMANELWSHGLDGLCHDVHPTARVEIHPGTDGEFIMEYLTTDGWRIKIIG